MRSARAISRQLPLSSGISIEPPTPTPPLRVPSHEPARDAQEARPPERLRLGVIGERGEMRAAEPAQFTGRIGRQAVGIKLREITDRVMNEIAAVARAG